MNSTGNPHHDNVFGHHKEVKAIVSLGTKDFGQKGWKLTAHRYYDKDKRDEFSTKVCIHKEKKECQVWKFQKEGSHWRIQLLDDAYHEKGSYLTAHRYYDQKDKRDDSSTFVFLHKEKKEGQLFDIHPAGNGLYRITLATDDYGQRGWALTAHRYYENDKRDDTSTFVCLHREQKEGQLWNIQRQDNCNIF